MIWQFKKFLTFFGNKCSFLFINYYESTTKNNKALHSGSDIPVGSSLSA
jgi:hypothetical protein